MSKAQQGENGPDLSKIADKQLRLLAALVTLEGEAAVTDLRDETGLSGQLARYHLEHTDNPADLVDLGCVKRQPHTKEVGRGKIPSTVYAITPTGQTLVKQSEDMPTYSELRTNVEILRQELASAHDRIDELESDMATLLQYVEPAADSEGES